MERVSCAHIHDHVLTQHKAIHARAWKFGSIALMVHVIVSCCYCTATTEQEPEVEAAGDVGQPFVVTRIVCKWSGPPAVQNFVSGSRADLYAGSGPSNVV